VFKLHQTIEYAKKHWPIVLGGLFGILVLYYLYKSIAGASSAGSSTATTATGSSDQLQALTTSASMQNAQLNAQVEVASYAANTQDNATAAGLQASLADTAAKLAVAQQSTSAGEVVALGSQQEAISIQQIQSNADVAKTNIQGETLKSLAVTAGQTQVAVQNAKNVVDLTALQNVNKQVGTLMQYSKHFGTDIQKIAPVIALETGQGSAAPSLAASNAKQGVASSTGATISAGASGISTILGALFA
jgi:hypothetical protein